VLAIWLVGAARAARDRRAYGSSLCPRQNSPPAGSKDSGLIHSGAGGYFTEMPEKDFPEQLERLRVTGVKRAKIKIGAGSQSDSERVSIARKVLGEHHRRCERQLHVR
jgi:L-alanine-DL-glutamate epimerase-like enolase superfamily enzyme